MDWQDWVVQRHTGSTGIFRSRYSSGQRSYWGNIYFRCRLDLEPFWAARIGQWGHFPNYGRELAGLRAGMEWFGVRINPICCLELREGLRRPEVSRWRVR